MLVANSIVLAVVGLSAGKADSSTVLSHGMPIAGLVLCLFWFALIKRGFDRYSYWILSARELEERYLAPAVRVVSRGGSYADGAPVELMLSGRYQTVQPSRVGRILSAARISYLVILTFVALYIGLFVVSI
jgi:hypothetical protein